MRGKPGAFTLGVIVLLLAVGWKMSGALLSVAPRERPSAHAVNWSALLDAGPMVASTQAKVTELTLSAVGDCTLGSDYRFAHSTSLEGKLEAVDDDFGYFFSGVREILADDDLTIANLETTLTTATVRMEKSPVERAFWFRGNPTLVGILQRGSVEAVNVANNHSHDYLASGFDDTLNNLQQASIGFFGYQHVYSTVVKGIRISLLGFESFGATNHGAGLSTFTSQVTSVVRKARKVSDIVVVSFHWGQEYAELPTLYQVQLAHDTIDAGADLILGHHPHIVQGVETYRGRHIVYSLGNFVFGGNVAVRDDGHSLIYQETFRFKDRELAAVQQRIVPVAYSTARYQNDYRPRVLSGTEKQAAEDKFETRTILLDLATHGMPPAEVNTWATLRERMYERGQEFEVPEMVAEENVAVNDDLVDFRTVVPEIVVDLVYATSDNVVGKRLYYREFPYLRAGTAQKLKRAQQLAREKGYGIKVWDAYRPPEVQWLLWDTRPDPRYVASPLSTYSLHNRGTAVDITLVDTHNRELPMPSGFDDLSPRANRSYQSASTEQVQNAVLLQDIMTRAGFGSIYNEWWHFADTDSERYGVVDIYRVLAALTFAGQP